MASQPPLVPGDVTVPHPHQSAPSLGTDETGLPVEAWSTAGDQGSLHQTPSQRQDIRSPPGGDPEGWRMSSSKPQRHGPIPGAQAVQAQPCRAVGVPTVSGMVEGAGGTGAIVGAQAGQGHCGQCGQLALAVVLAIFSPLLALGVCVADVITGECCRLENMKDMEDFIE